MNTATALYLYLDIETAPTHDPVLVDELFLKHTAVATIDLSTITAAANLKDETKIAEEIAKRRAKALADQDAARAKGFAEYEEAFRKTCLDATTGHIACISLALGGDDVFHVSNTALHGYADPMDADLVPLDDVLAAERRMLEVFFFEVEAMLSQRARGRAEADWEAHEPRQIKDGHWQLMISGTAHKYSRFVSGREHFVRENIHPVMPIVVAHHAGFDLRYIWQRAIILGVPVPTWWPHEAKPWDTSRVEDTMTGWSGATGRIGLNRLCKALGIPDKEGMDGSKVWDAIREGRLADVCAYCDGDVERLRAVHRRIRQFAITETTKVETFSTSAGGHVGFVAEGGH